MRAGKDLPREAEDESSSEYTEVTEEELPAPETRSAAGKSGPFAPTPKPVVSEVPLASSESEDYVRPKGGRPKGEKPREARTAATKRNSSSSSSPARPRPSKGSKGGKGKKSSAFTRCGHCWARVSTVHRNSLAQHQKWNHVCVTWQYHNKGLAWPDAQGKAQRKIERRQQRGWEPEKKRKKNLAVRVRTHGGLTVAVVGILTRTVRTARDGIRRSTDRMATRGSSTAESALKEITRAGTSRPRSSWILNAATV